MDQMDSATHKELFSNAEAMVEQPASELHQRKRSIEVLKARCAALMGAETRRRTTGTGEQQGRPAPSTLPIVTLEQLDEFESNAGASETFRQRVLEEMKEAYRFKMGMLFAPELLIRCTWTGETPGKIGLWRYVNTMAILASILGARDPSITPKVVKQKLQTAIKNAHAKVKRVSQ